MDNPGNRRTKYQEIVVFFSRLAISGGGRAGGKPDGCVRYPRIGDVFDRQAFLNEMESFR
jgi:hypothetical protein